MVAFEIIFFFLTFMPGVECHVDAFQFVLSEVKFSLFFFWIRVFSLFFFQKKIVIFVDLRATGNDLIGTVACWSSFALVK